MKAFVYWMERTLLTKNYTRVDVYFAAFIGAAGAVVVIYLLS